MPRLPTWSKPRETAQPAGSTRCAKIRPGTAGPEVASLGRTYASGADRASAVATGSSTRAIVWPGRTAWTSTQIRRRAPPRRRPSSPVASRSVCAGWSTVKAGTATPATEVSCVVRSPAPAAPWTALAPSPLRARTLGPSRRLLARTMAKATCSSRVLSERGGQSLLRYALRLWLRFPDLRQARLYQLAYRRRGERLANRKAARCSSRGPRGPPSAQRRLRR